MQFFQGKESERERFRQASLQLSRLISEAGTPVKQAAFLEYAIRCIGRELAAVTSTAQLYGESVPQSYDFSIPLIKDDEIQSQEPMHRTLTDYNVICLPWKASKITNAAFEVFTHGFLPEKGFYNVVLYPEIRLAVVINGKHHMAVASTMGKASARCITIHLTELFPVIQTDGAYWYRDDIGAFEVADYRLALLYELARKREKLNEAEQIERPTELLPPVFETPKEELDRLRLLQRRNYTLEQDNRIMSEMLRKLLPNEF